MLKRMTDAVSVDVMRDLWARFVLPSAFFYWHKEQIYTDPSDTEFWVYARR